MISSHRNGNVRDALEGILVVRGFFVLETVLLEAFGVSWLVNGGTFFKDRQA
jgi:hypothetical protein